MYLLILNSCGLLHPDRSCKKYVNFVLVVPVLFPYSVITISLAAKGRSGFCFALPFRIILNNITKNLINVFLELSSSAYTLLPISKWNTSLLKNVAGKYIFAKCVIHKSLQTEIQTLVFG